MENSSSLPDIVGAILQAKAGKIQAYPQHTNRASEAGHACERYLVLCRTAWEERALHDASTELVFDGGRMIEEMAIRWLSEAGFQVLEQQRPFEWRAYELTGHLDLKIAGNGLPRPIPVEIKGLNHHDAVKLNGFSDFIDSPRPWVRKYPAQLMLYELMNDSDLGAFLIVDKLSYQPKVVWLPLDYQYADGILQKLERVNHRVKAGTLPPPINDYSWCERCPFMHKCLPEIKAGSDLEFLDDPDLEDMLLRRDSLQEAASEFTLLDRQVKFALEGRPKVTVGDFLIESRQINRKGYTVPDSSYWRTTISRLGGASQ